MVLTKSLMSVTEAKVSYILDTVIRIKTNNDVYRYLLK